MDIEKMSVGQRIRFFRESKHLTQNELADMVGTSPQNIYKYEQGIITNISINRIVQIAKALDVPPARIAGWDMEIVVNHGVVGHSEDIIDLSTLNETQRTIIRAVLQMDAQEQAAYRVVAEGIAARHKSQDK